MMRLPIVLLLVLAVAALGLVTSQHKARRLFTQLEQEQSREKQLEIEFGQLQLEQSTWAMHARIEKLAAERLKMRAVDVNRVQPVPEPAR